VLFIVGNGFDLALGLKTSYRDFVEWYIKQIKRPEDQRISNFKNNIKNDIGANINSWADLEIKLGEYTNLYKKDEADDFLFIYRDMKEKLNEYIKNQESMVDLSDSDAIVDALSQFLLGFYREFPTNTRNLLVNTLEKRQANIQYNFVTFNYTQTLEDCLNLLPTPFGERGNYTDTLGSVLHLHGEIDKAPLIGVDSDSQILNDAFRSDKRIMRALVKPLMNKEMQENVEIKAHTLINASNVICLFGTSLGDSDISWWVKIGEWLKASASRRLIVFWYSAEPLSTLHYDIKLTEEDNVRMHFIKKAGFTESESAQVANRIIVHIYTNILDMKLIPDEALQNVEA